MKEVKKYIHSTDTGKEIKAWVVKLKGEIIFVESDWGFPPHCATVFKSRKSAKEYADWTNFNKRDLKVVRVVVTSLLK